MKSAVLVIAGLGLGFLIGSRFRAKETNCCKRLSKAIRDKASDKLPGPAVAIGDLFHVWEHAPGLLDAIGYDT